MLKIIVAYDNSFTIGNKNKLPWHNPEDLKHFHDETKGKIILMGRVTFESIKNPLPDRKTIILTENKDYKVKDGDFSVFHDLNTVLEYAKNKEIYICGGSKIYELFLNYANEMIITEIKGRYTGDRFFPIWNKDDFKLVSEKKLNEEAVVKYYKRVKNII